jgi:hypothetical protein
MSESKDVIFFTPESKKEVLKVKNNFFNFYLSVLNKFKLNFSLF